MLLVGAHAGEAHERQRQQAGGDEADGRPGEQHRHFGLRERIALAEVPMLFAGPPIGFITAGLLAMAFMGFSGMSTN